MRPFYKKIIKIASYSATYTTAAVLLLFPGTIPLAIGAGIRYYKKKKRNFQTFRNKKRKTLDKKLTSETKETTSL